MHTFKDNYNRGYTRIDSIKILYKITHKTHAVIFTHKLFIYNNNKNIQTKKYKKKLVF